MSEFFQRPVVYNTIPVSYLCKAGLGHLLARLFPKVLTSTAVAHAFRGPLISTFRAASMIHIQQMTGCLS